VSPLILLYHGIMGLKATSPGFATCVIAPQPCDLKQIECQAWTVRGPISFSLKRESAGRELKLMVPAEIDAELILEASEDVGLSPGKEPAPTGCRSYRLPKGKIVTLMLKYSAV